MLADGIINTMAISGNFGVFQSDYGKSVNLLIDAEYSVLELTKWLFNYSLMW